MFNYQSTRDPLLKVRPAQAILQGIAADGGLYLPEDLHALAFDYRRILAFDYRQMADWIIGRFFPDLDSAALCRLTAHSYGCNFDEPLITPLRKVGNSYLLELFHGPTGAFKDLALAVLPGFMKLALDQEGITQRLLILTATSGDTGSAALCGFADQPLIEAIAFFPDQGISAIQRRQMTAAKGSNTFACAVTANFDAIQQAVKDIYAKHPGQHLSSANSINIGRLIPQIVYYYAAYQQLIRQQIIADGTLVNFVVPTGNFGNILAGYLAKMLGLPIQRLICATNQNDVLKDFIQTGHYDKNRRFHQTLSPSMDILVSSNLERLLYLLCGSQKTQQYMRDFTEKGSYQLTGAELKALQAVFWTGTCSDIQTNQTIWTVYRNDHYLLDPHTAVAYHVGQQFSNRNEQPTVILATATPFKFPETVLNALNVNPGPDEFKNMQKLAEISGSLIPASLCRLNEQPIKHHDVITIQAMEAYVTERLKQNG